MPFFLLSLPKNLPLKFEKFGIPFLLKGKRSSRLVDQTRILWFTALDHSKKVFPYSYHFKTLNNHILVENELTGNANEDSKQILTALKKGNAFIANDSVKSARGFRFYTAANENSHIMGEELSFKDGITLTVELPSDAECVLLKDGKPVLRKQKCSQITYSVESTGCYRIECYRRYLFERRGWIFSNPIYIR